MTKLMKKKRFRYVLAAVLLIGCFYGLYQGYHYWRYGQYVYYEPELVIKDYAFFNDGRAVVIDWEQKDKAEDAKLLKAVENGKTALNRSYSGIVSGQRYLTTTSIKLKVDPTYDSLEKAGGLTRNRAKKGEYWTVNVYDLSQKRPTKKSYDVFKAVRAYAPDKAPILYYRTSYAVDGKEYLPIILQSLEDSTGEKEMAVMDLATGKLEAAIPRADFVPLYWANRLNNTTSLKDYYKDKVENNTDSSVTLLKREIVVSASKTWQLKDESPKALKLLQNGRSRLYILSNGTDPKLATSVWQQLLPEGQDLFDNLTIYERFTVDGQEHTVNSYDEFARYYKTTDETEETDGTKDD